jgi:two-component system, OmpR family, catabolic regulation response regulator CreB
MKPLILIVEDEPAIADTIKYALATDGFEPLWCNTGEAALQHFAQRAPALVILDVGLPDLNGLEVFKRMRARADVPAVFLTARNDEIDRVVGLELGADDYIAKPFSPRELVARVRTILRRAQATAGSGNDAGKAATAAHLKPVAVDDERRMIRFYGKALDLSRYEYGILKTLAHRPGRVFTRDELLELVWDDPAASFDRTVDAHIKTLRAKLKAVAPGLEPIRTSRGTGYALAEDLPGALLEQPHPPPSPARRGGGI